jgi:hypothetical protein
MLNTLIIEEALPTLLPDDPSPDNPPPRQLLGNLHTLTLCGSVDACSRLLQQLCYATATAVMLKCDIEFKSQCLQASELLSLLLPSEVVTTRSNPCPLLFDGSP